ncbi:ATP-binding cassette domain-containing protein [Actinophytocola xanthii]|uniref:ABC transporter n=1 Tax=Actinophytocola xanthii TaxID=1912961 RepID=A0A1Q8CK28_9PSEU|nr:ABC transporter ATP-binding protein [Actinophytocola xanthii]OLF14702.1 hypothetical protein BU204_25775 [Actinophytocola xanthii]
MTKPAKAHRNALYAAIALSWTADRRATLLTFVGFGLRPALPVLIAYLVKVMVDAAVVGDTDLLVRAALGIGTAAALSAGSVPYAVELSTRMIESTAVLVDRKLMTLTGSLPTVQDLDDPEVLDRLEVLRQERVRLSEGADAVALVLGAAVRAGVTAVVLAVVDPFLLLTPLLAVPAVVAASRMQARRTAALDTAAADARLARHLYEVGSAPRWSSETRLFGLGPAIRRRYHEAAERADRHVVGALGRALLPVTAAGVLFAAGYIGALLLVTRQFAAGGATLGEVVLTLNLVTLISIQVGQAVQFLAFLHQTVDASRRLLSLESYVENSVARTGGDRSAPAVLRYGISLAGVGLRYPGSGRWALRDVSLHLPAGSVVAVVGVNGAGKSSLIKLLTGLYEPTEGTITVDGESLTGFRPGAWQARTSGCFQDFVRPEFTVATAVGVGDLATADDPDAVRAAVRHGAADGIVAALPDGLATPLGSSHANGTELSGGQWQRLALARARMRPSPCLLVLDEPTSAIDPLAEDVTLRRYLAAARLTAARANGVTVVASHRLATARAADLVIVIAAGAVVQFGSHQRLMADSDGPYRELYERQSGAYS